MKKLIFISAIFSAILFSCKKDDDVKPEPTEPKINFGEWANTGNNIFTTPMPTDSIP